jgi:S-adenosylmethionine:tRNA ribosyltransferase-isomerase
MTTKDFFYDLPPELIAQTPAEPRDSSRLLRLDRNSGEISHHIFRDVVDFLRPGDCLVLNDSRVLPARLFTDDGVELLLLRCMELGTGKARWECIVKPGRKCKVGRKFTISNIFEVEVADVFEDGNRVVDFKFDPSKDFYSLLDTVGNMPLPPYITEKLSDKERYQTVYSHELGSAAAPTAGLHWTPELLEKSREKDVSIAKVTLHVGLGTFRPVKVDDVAKHHMHSEHYELTEENAAIIRGAKRVIAVGTTSVRTLETIAAQFGEIAADSGFTDIFIYPSYNFGAVDAMITNFHLPESTLMMLVSAFAGKDSVFAAYEEAIAEKYRFFSFGDAMIIE